MTEFRTTIKAEESFHLLQLMLVIARNINPAITLRNEIFRDSVLVRVLFTDSSELETFLSTLSEHGVELKKWSRYEETDLPG
jgi:hypothetical protein